jgi:SAM-dependent methyltransferase
MPVYNQPQYYEIAFSFFDVKKQCDLIERFARKYSGIEVKRILDIACGPGLQILEFARRGYDCTGLDNSPHMLKYLSGKARDKGVDIHTSKADMCKFSSAQKYDLATIMMGSISLIESNERFLSHLDSVAKSLWSGGLYIIENAETDWTKDDFFGAQSWVMERDGIQVETTYELCLKDTLKQTGVATITLDVYDHGKEFFFEESRDVKIIFPSEFLTLIELNGKFEFIGWFEPDKVKKLKSAKENNFAILKRK